jgi:hypothetical protein
MLEAWHDFFILLGTAAAALVALLFVAVSVGVGFLSFESAAGTRTYMSPVVVHFTGVLFACAAGLVPGLGAASCAWIFGAGAAAGVIYSVIIAVPILRNPATDLDDKICHGIVPPISYALGLIAAVLFYRGSPAAPDVLALTFLILLAGNIRNAWDLVLFMARKQTEAQRRTNHT